MSTTVSEMVVTREDLNPCTVKLTVTCSEEQIKAGFDKAVKELGKKVRVPGFRPGMAPKKLVEDALNPQAVYERAADILLRKSYEEVVEKEGLKQEGVPSVDITKIQRGGEETESGEVLEPAFEYVVKVPLAPVVELGALEGLEAQRPPVEVSDEEVEGQIEELRRRQGKKGDVVGRGIQEGDAAVVTLKAAGEDGPGRTFMVVVGQTFEGLDTALAGMTTDEVKLVDLSYPESFQHEAWKGQTLKTEVLVKSVSAVQLPDLDDTFAQGFRMENLEELRTRVREGILGAKEAMVKDMVRDQLLDDLLAKSTVHVADNTWESVVQRRLEELGRELQSRGATFEQYLQANNLSKEEFQATLEREAQLNVRRAVVIQKIFTEKGYQVEASDIDRHFRQILAENNVPAEKADDFARQFGGQIREEIVFRAMAAKVTDFLMEHASVREVATSGVGGEKPQSRPAKGTKKKSEK